MDALATSKEYNDIEAFNENIKSLKDSSARTALVHQLWDSIKTLLVNYPKDVSLIEKVCRVFTDSTIYVLDGSAYPSSSGLVSLFFQVISDVDWKEQPITLVEAAVEVTGSLSDVFSSALTPQHIETLSSFLSSALDVDTYGDCKETFVVAVGRVFPHNVSDDIMIKFHEDNIHIKLCQLLTYYGGMKERDIVSVLALLSSFIDFNPSVVDQFLSESFHYMILFAAQQFAKCPMVQEPLWSILAKVNSHSLQFAEDINAAMLGPLLSAIVKEQMADIVKVDKMCAFVINYVLTGGTALIGYCMREDKSFLSSLLKIFDKTIDEVKSKEDAKEIETVGDLAGLFCSKMKTSYIKEIVELDVISQMEKGVVKWPRTLCQCYCECLDSVITQFPPDPSSLPPQLRRLINNLPQDISDAKASFFASNHLLPFHTLLSSPATCSSEFRDTIYFTIRQLLKCSPDESVNKWLTEEFLQVYVKALKEDSTRDSKFFSAMMFTTHYIIYSIKEKELIQVLHDLKFHDIAVDDCLAHATRHDSRVNTLNMINCLLRSYQSNLKDIKPFAEGNLADHLVQLAYDFGHATNPPSSSLGEQFGALALGLTADKNASAILHKKGFVTKLYKLVSKHYEMPIARSSVHAIGNIALAGHPVKQEILAENFHEVLINMLDREVNSADASLLTACCRVLHILSSGDWAKQKFAQLGLVDILMRLMDTRRESAEICWRPLGLLSSIGFMSLSNRQFIMINEVMDSICRLLEAAKDKKVLSYIALVFLASSDIDRQLTYLCSRGVVRKFQHILSDDSSLANNDLKRWGTSLLEKGHLFTVLSKSQSSGDLTSHLDQSINWPSSFGINNNSNTKVVSLLPPESKYLTPKFPEGPSVKDEAKDRLKQLGLNPDQPFFRISRVYGSTHGLCSNCDKEGPSEELVFRPRNLTPHQYQSLINRGWYRRGAIKLFRYRFNHNIKCSDWETRVIVSEFNQRKRNSHRKVLRRMPEERLTIETVPTQFMQESYDLYNSYHLAKHDKPRKSQFSYCEHVVNAPVRNQTIDGFEYGTFHQLYRLDGRLVAVGVIDIVPEGVVSIYMWYDMSKEVTKLSFGTYSALKEIEFTRQLSERNPNIKYYYMQGWNGNNHKLAYKANFEPEEFYSPCTVQGWTPSLDGVSKAQDDYSRSKEVKEQTDSSSIAVDPTVPPPPIVNDTSTTVGVVSGVALPFDRECYKAVTGSDKVNVSRLVMCLNDSQYMDLNEMTESFDVSKEQCHLMEERYEELVLAVGNELASNMIIDIKACPSSF
jgi:arginyl-tRNA--protein-N-Asp/Glu arginylyltransferase